MIVNYYIIHPNGREKLKPTPKNDEEALIAFKNHWTATANWMTNIMISGKSKRSLVKECKEEIFTEEIKTKS